MDEPRAAGAFSLLGGPLHRLGARLGLVRHGNNTVRLGLALAAVLWGVLVGLALVEGLAGQVFSLAVIGGHARLLLAIPLFFVCETWLDPCTREFVGSLRRWGVIGQDGLARFEDEIRREARRRESWLGEAVCLVVAVGMTFLAPDVGLAGATAAPAPGRAAEATLTGGWYFYVCLPVFRFLILRWVWRLVRWWSFLRRLSRLDLRLEPAHPDGAGGIGYLDVVQAQFSPLVAAISIVQASALAEEIAAGRVALQGALPSLGFVLALDALLFVGPATCFAPKLWLCRLHGLSQYTGFASRYARRFDAKWIGPDDPAQVEEVLGTPDLQSLADLGNSLDRVRAMSVIPVGRRMLVQLAVAAIVPWLPLLLFKYPVMELAETFLRTVTGLG